MIKLLVIQCCCLMVFGLSQGVFIALAEDDTAMVSDGTLRRIRVPVLMYHYVSVLPEDADDIRADLTVGPDLFAGHLYYLHANDYTPISLYQLHAALLTGQPLPARPVVLTFDDGHIDHYTHVFPMLQEYGYTATFFIITGLIDTNHPDYLTWPQVQQMAAAGMDMEPHTKNHLALHGRGRDFLVYEMLGSRESIRAHTGQPARMFSYPAGRYDDETLQIAREMDIWRAVTTQAGMHHTTDNRLELARVRVHGGTTAAGLAYLLRGDWLD